MVVIKCIRDFSGSVGHNHEFQNAEKYQETEKNPSSDH
jgi:hypothetical protein